MYNYLIATSGLWGTASPGSQAKPTNVDLRPEGTHSLQLSSLPSVDDLHLPRLATKPSSWVLLLGLHNTLPVSCIQILTRSSIGNNFLPTSRIVGNRSSILFSAPKVSIYRPALGQSPTEALWPEGVKTVIDQNVSAPLLTLIP
ncbi:hypothetical protein BDV38DRAFT_157980 [Aspergillus pseudotamarii]|uniref:Uncharacterized protein n=1 Tax=Aspergillus pseudotamarii TaxID=132259 RepID=A0A5N6SLL1_ASPPS|nr:uncharacterized protein BDV38DRAFT_157980 [Aspergillus pseudotamarii]KAE8134581.1 hypothetical protein BDV38DRAFT_157980 [Aspergillus pseudotamarii]